jgi:hypothetical protein
MLPSLISIFQVILLWGEQDRGDSSLDKGDILEADIWRGIQQVSQRSNKPLQDNRMQLQDVDGGPQGQDVLTKPFQDVLFDKDGDRSRFSGKLTRYQLITNIVSG